MKNKTKCSECSTTNRFEVLADKENDSDMDTDPMVIEEEEHKENPGKNKNPKTRRPPPLVIHGNVTSHTEFIQALKNITNENFHIKYHENFTEVFTSNHEQYTLLKERWLKNNIRFHTYATDKRRTFVIRGLHNQTETAEIKQDLEAMGYKVINLNIMNNTNQTKHMVTFKGNIQKKQLEQQARYICSTKVFWDDYITKKRITQCRKCQGWGHATVNCYADPACLKCAQNHLTKDCTKSKETPAKCVNCELDHPANATICREYQRRLKIIEQRNRILQHNHNTEETAQNKSALDPSKGKHYPNLQATRRYHGRESKSLFQFSHNADNQPYHVQYEGYNNKSHRGPNDNTKVTMTRETAGRTLYSDITRQKYALDINSNIDPTIFTHNNNELSDLSSLIKEIREINKVFNIKEMLSAVREFKNQLHQCNTKSEQFQLLIQFCDKFDNE